MIALDPLATLEEVLTRASTALGLPVATATTLFAGKDEISDAAALHALPDASILGLVEKASPAQAPARSDNATSDAGSVSPLRGANRGVTLSVQIPSYTWGEPP